MNMGNNNSEKTAELQTVIEQIYSWSLQRELTWGIVVLTCLTGLIQLLAISEENNFWFLVSSSAIYVTLSSVLAYSLYYFSKLYRYSRKVLASEHLNQEAKKYVEATRGIHSFLLNPKISKFLSVISFCTLLITWFSKIGA
jgi:hypothetical protein